MNIGPPPARPIPAEPPSVPWLPAVLPVILSVVMALVFRSPLALAKPDVAVAWDGGGVLPPGRARWGDSQIQIASGASAPRSWAPPESTPAPGPPLVLTRDESVWEGSDTKFVGTPETWAMKGLEIASVLARHRVIITELSPGEIRYATAGRIVLPPLPIPPDQWVVWDQGTVSLVSAERFLP